MLLRHIDPHTCSDEELETGRRKLADDIINLAVGTTSSEEWLEKLGAYMVKQGFPEQKALGVGLTRSVISLPLFLVVKVERKLHERLVCANKPEDTLEVVTEEEIQLHIASGDAIEENTANYIEEQNALQYPWMIAKTYGRFCAKFDPPHSANWPHSFMIQEQLVPLGRVVHELTEWMGVKGAACFDTGMRPRTGQFLHMDGARTPTDALKPPPTAYLDSAEPSFFDAAVAYKS